MPAVSQHAPSSTNSSFKPDVSDPCEPDEQWKIDLKAKVEESLQSMVQEAKNNRDTQLNSAVVSVAGRDRIGREFLEAMALVTQIAQESFVAELAEERKRRRKDIQLHILNNIQHTAQHIDGFSDSLPEVRQYNVPPVAVNEAPPHVQVPVQSAPASAPQHREEHERSSPRPQTQPRATRRTSDAQSTASRDAPFEPAPLSRRSTKQGRTSADRQPIPEPWIGPEPDVFDEPEEMTYRPPAAASATPRNHRNSVDRSQFISSDRMDGGHPSSLGRSTGSVRSDKSIARSPPKAQPEVWKPTISAGEDSGSGSAASKPYAQVGRRGSSASLTSMRSTNSGASIRPSITETIPERADDVDEIMSSEPRHDKRKSADKPPREKEKRANRRRDSRPSPVDAALRSYDDPPPPASALSSSGLRSSTGSVSGPSSATMQYATSSSAMKSKSLSSKSSFASVEDRYHPERPLKPQSYSDPRIEPHQPSREVPYTHREQPPYSARDVLQRPPPPRSPYAVDGPDREYSHSPSYGPPSRPMSTKAPFSEYDYVHGSHAPVSRKPSFNHDDRRREREPPWEREREREVLSPPHWEDERDLRERERADREHLEREREREYAARERDLRERDRERERERERERDREREREQRERERDLFIETRQHPNHYPYSSRPPNTAYSSSPSSAATRHTPHDYLPNEPIYDDREVRDREGGIPPRAYGYRPQPPPPLPPPPLLPPHSHPPQSAYDDWEHPRETGRPIPSRQHSFNRREDPDNGPRRMTGELADGYDGYSTRYTHPSGGVAIPRHTTGLNLNDEPAPAPAWKEWANESGGSAGLARRASDAHRVVGAGLDSSLNYSSTRSPPPPPPGIAAAVATAASAQQFQRRRSGHAHPRAHAPSKVYHYDDDGAYPASPTYESYAPGTRARRKRKPSAAVESDELVSESETDEDEDSALSEGSEDADEEDENEEEEEDEDYEEEEEEEDEEAIEGGDEVELYGLKREGKKWREEVRKTENKLKEAERESELEAARKQKELKEKEAEVRRKEEEVRRKEEEMRKKEEEAEQKRLEDERKELEKVRLEEDLKRQAEDARLKEAEAKRLEAEALKLQEETTRKAKEAKRKEADLKKKEQMTKKKEQQLKEEAERTMRLREEAEQAARDATEKQEKLRLLEEETAKKEREVQERERVLALREQDFTRREEEARHMREEAIRKEEEARLKEEQANRKQQQMRDEERRREREEERRKERLKTEEEKNAKIKEEEEAKREEATREEARREEIRRKEALKLEEAGKAAQANKRLEEEVKRKKVEAERRQKEKEILDDDLLGIGIVNIDDNIIEQQAYILQQAQYQQRAEKILSSRAEERKRNDSFGNDGPWSSQFIPSSSPGTSPGIPKPSPKPNGSSNTDRGSTTSNSTRSTTGSAWSTSTAKPFSTASPTSARSPTGAVPTGKPRTGSVSSGTFPTASPPHAGSFSESDHARRQAEFANGQQEKFRLEQEMLEAQRQMKSAGKPLSKPEAQKVLEHHERLWSRLALSDISDLTWTDFPWPMWRAPSGPDDISSALISSYFHSPSWSDKNKPKTPKDRIKEHIKKWHPDRFETKLLSRVMESEQERVKQGAGNVTRYLSDLLRKENENSSSVNIFGD